MTMTWGQLGILAFLLIGIAYAVAQGFDTLAEHLREIRGDLEETKSAVENIRDNMD